MYIKVHVLIMGMTLIPVYLHKYINILKSTIGLYISVLSIFKHPLLHSFIFN